MAVKPHASPVFHAIQYLFGHQTQDKLERFRGAGRRAGPSRTKDTHLTSSTGSVGLGVAMTLFSSPAADYVRLKISASPTSATMRPVGARAVAEIFQPDIVLHERREERHATPRPTEPVEKSTSSGSFVRDGYDCAPPSARKRSSWSRVCRPYRYWMA